MDTFGIMKAVVIFDLENRYKELGLRCGLVVNASIELSRRNLAMAGFRGCCD